MTNSGTSAGAIPAQLSDRTRAIVRAGFAKEVDAVILTAFVFLAVGFGGPNASATLE